jgi:hypothetical protein
MSIPWRRARDWMIAHPLAVALLSGLVARMVAASVALGFHARDDYFHVLDIAARWAADPSFDWDASDRPGAGIRSHLLPRAVWVILVGARSLGIDEPETVLRIVYACAGLYSMLAIPAIYLAARRLLDGRGVLLATGLAALHFAMPYAGTRLLIEAFAIPPLALGLWLATYSSGRRLFFAGVAIGLACWFRFQVGVAALAFAVVIGLGGRREAGWGEAARRVLSFAAGGAVAVTAQGLFDLWTTGDFLGPVVRNIAINLNPHEGLSRSNPAAYLGFWLLLTVPPATFVLLPMLARAARGLPLVTWPLLAFILVHSLIPHKEDRFMLPALPLFLVLLAAAPAALETARGRWWERLRRLWPATRNYLVVMHVVALLLATTAQSQANLRRAMVALRDDPGVSAVLSMGPEVQDFFLGRPDVMVRRISRVDAVWLANNLRNLNDLGIEPNRFLAFAAEAHQIQILLPAFGFVCDPPQPIDGWWLDRLVFALNPRRNKRRSPVLLWSCSRPALALPSTPFDISRLAQAEAGIAVHPLR